MHRQSGKRPSSRSIRDFSRKIALYGDDIIVPTEYTDAVVHELESYGLRVNVNKSFRQSLFRESCGADYYNGYAVRPVYARQSAPDDVRQWTASHIMSWAAVSDQFYMAGHWHVAQVVRDMLESILQIKIPRARKPGNGVSFLSLIVDTDCRFNRSTYTYEQRRLVFNPLKQKDDIDGSAVACLNKWGQSRATHRRSEYSLRGNSERYSCGSRFSHPEHERYQRTLLGLQSRMPIFGQEGDEFSDVPDVSSRKDREVASVNNLAAIDKSSSRGNLDFRTSVKRGVFKSKRRWVTLTT
jgi:hypothetical protein